MEQNAIIVPRIITRKFIQKHPEWIFVYSHDVAGKSFFGQSYECHNEPNTFPVPVMWKACKISGYFQESQSTEINKLIDEAINRIPLDSRPIIPLRKMGCGYSRFREFCMSSYEYMMARLHVIAYPNIVINYNE